MKKYLVGIAVLALVIGGAVTGCQNPSTTNDPVITGNYVFTGTDGNEYVLVILDNGTYTLTTIKDGIEVTSTGTYTGEPEGTKTLHPSTGSGTIVVNPKAGGGADITVAGEIPFTDQDGKEVDVTLPAEVEAEAGKNSLVITGLGGLYKNGTKVYVGAAESKDVDSFGEPVQGTVTNGSLTVSLDIKNGSYYTGFSSDGLFYFISKTRATFSGGPVSKAYTDFELYVFSMKLGDTGLTSSMTIDAVIQMSEEMPGGPTTYAEWKTAMRQGLLESLGDLYVSLDFLDVAFYKDAACTREFSGTDTVGPDTVVYFKYSPGGNEDGGDSGSHASTPAVDTGTTIAGCAYTDMEQDSGYWSWSYEHYLLSSSVTFDQALTILKANWGEPDETIDCSIQNGNGKAVEAARTTGGVLFEVTDSDYRLGIWDEITTGDWSVVIWHKQDGRSAPQDTGTTIGGCAYSQKDGDSGSTPWSYKHYILSISYEEALSVLIALWGNPMTGWSLQTGSTLSDQAYQNNGVIFEDTTWDYRLVRVLDGRWEAVGWNK